jgi:hypothetical protein
MTTLSQRYELNFNWIHVACRSIFACVKWYGQVLWTRIGSISSPYICAKSLYRSCTYAWIENVGGQCLSNDAKVQEMDLLKHDTNRSAPNIPSLAPLLVRCHLELLAKHKNKIPHEINIICKVLVSFEKQNQSISNYPMHASFSFHHSNLQLAYTTQAWNFNLKLVPCKQTYEMHIQMHQSSLRACSPYLCAQILIDPLSLSYFSPYVKVLPFVMFSLSLCISPPPLIG